MQYEILCKDCGGESVVEAGVVPCFCPLCGTIDIDCEEVVVEWDDYEDVEI
jgi:hypothetical protein